MSWWGIEMPKRVSKSEEVRSLKQVLAMVSATNAMPIAVAWSMEQLEAMRNHPKWVPVEQYGRAAIPLANEIGMVVGQARVLGSVMTLDVQPANVG